MSAGDDPRYKVWPSAPCPYCKRDIRMIGARFSNVDDGELHTCGFTEYYRGPMYAAGDFFHPDWLSPAETEGPLP